MARAWRGLWAMLGRAWRGHGAGVARAFPVPPRVAEWAFGANMGRQHGRSAPKIASREQKKSVPGRNGEYLGGSKVPRTSTRHSDVQNAANEVVKHSLESAVLGHCIAFSGVSKEHGAESVQLKRTPFWDNNSFGGIFCFPGAFGAVFSFPHFGHLWCCFFQRCGVGGIICALASCVQGKKQPTSSWVHQMWDVGSLNADSLNGDV
eukprot:gene9690-biopygen18234